MDLGGREVGVLSESRAAGPHHRVRAGKEPVDQVDVGLRIDDDTVLGAGQKTEQRAVVTDFRARCRPPPQWISFWRLDFDDLGAAVGQQLRAVGAGDTDGQIDDGVPVEWAGSAPR